MGSVLKVEGLGSRGWGLWSRIKRGGWDLWSRVCGLGVGGCGVGFGVDMSAPTSRADAVAPAFACIASRVFISQKLFIQLLCKSQFTHKFVNVSFIITHVNNAWTDLCGN